MVGKLKSTKSACCLQQTHSKQNRLRSWTFWQPGPLQTALILRETCRRCTGSTPTPYLRYSSALSAAEISVTPPLGTYKKNTCKSSGEISAHVFHTWQRNTLKACFLPTPHSSTAQPTGGTLCLLFNWEGTSKGSSNIPKIEEFLFFNFSFYYFVTILYAQTFQTMHLSLKIQNSHFLGNP